MEPYQTGDDPKARFRLKNEIVNAQVRVQLVEERSAEQPLPSAPIATQSMVNRLILLKYSHNFLTP